MSAHLNSLFNFGARHRIVAVALLITISLVIVPTAHADIWKRVDENGMSHFSNRHMGKGSVLVMRTKRKRTTNYSGAPSAALARNKALYTPLIEEAARQFQLDANLIHAVVRAESAYIADAQSHKGAVGLMQLMPATAERYGVSDRTDPGQNIKGGVRYLRDLLLMFRNVTLAVAAYNAGENAVIRHGRKIPPYPETQNYVQKVIGFYQALGKAS